MNIKESEKIIKYLGHFQRAEKTVEREGDGDTNHNRWTWNGHQRIEKKKTGRSGNQRKNRDHLDHSVFNTG